MQKQTLSLPEDKQQMSREHQAPENVVYVCTGSKCKKKGSKQIGKSLKAFAKHQNLKKVSIIRTHCTDNCKRGPVICFQPENAWHFHMDEPHAIALLKKYCVTE